jgi:site-specific recombinase XerD
VKILTEFKGKAYFNFIESLHAEYTQRTYTYALRNFLRYIQLTNPEELLSIPLDTLEEKIKQYLVYLAKEKKVTFQVKVNFAAIKHFCRMNKIKIDWDLMRSFKARTKWVKYSTGNKDDAYTHGQIRSLLEVCNMRFKVVGLIYASTGIRLSALPPLKLRHLEKIGDVYKFIIYEDDEEYFTFCTPECASAIDSYLEFRTRYGEKLGPESPLIRNEFNIYDIGKKRLNARHISNNNIQCIMFKHLNSLGIRQIDHVNRNNMKKVKLMHGFRKFFVTQLAESGVDCVVRKMLAGHDVELDENYFQPSLDFMLGEYRKAIDALTINPENRLKREVTALQERNDRLDRVLAKVDLLEKQLGIT